MNDRELLVRLAQAPCSGSMLAREFGLTRAAVWKHIHSLRSAGVEIRAQPGSGYVLAAPLDLLDAARTRKELPAEVATGIDTLDVAWEIDSTNAELLRRAATSGVQVLLAERQSAGRGRRGRAWASPLAAHLYLSLQRRFDGGVAALAGLSIAVGVAAAEALHGLGFAEVGLKWPNDLIATDRKLGGILIEFGGEDAGVVRAVIGIGINVRMPKSAAAVIDQPWIDLQRLGVQMPSRNALATALIAAQVRALDQFAEAGLAPFLPRWRELDALRDRAVEVIAGTHRDPGIALGIADNGALRVRHADGERDYHSAEISVRMR
ncbi:MAG TPA: bifunctional biotin--[acetyl-CoA-carboxylase] ligase/biotin operon repressor BirA [Xanthomonadaceae bacterium]|nr:bifunctional biotin--[acetyl-CoA-carboxylase] ligase/biotin operon repressor BirA [Xanthomonadaceae bacterium]